MKVAVPMSEQINIPVIMNHKDFLVVYKPEGINVHSEAEEPGFIVLCEKQFDQSLYPVHRLDRVTSGLLILAKHREAAADFGRLFEQHQIQKYYLAISAKKPSKKQGTIIGDMKKARGGVWKLLHSQQHPAITQFFSKGLGGDGMRAFLIKPLTGKTHQIRVALKSLGSPILGDVHYSAISNDRVYLHAWRLSFQWGDGRVSVVTPPTSGHWFLAPAFKNACEEWGEPESLPWPKIKIAPKKKISSKETVPPKKNA